MIKKVRNISYLFFIYNIMKNIKTFELFNESLKDKIVGKSNDELIKSLDDLKDSDKIKMIFKYKLSYDYQHRQ